MFIDEILVESPLYALWFYWLVLINLVSVVFVFWSREARWIFLVFLVNIFALELLYGEIGYGRLLSLSHIVLWTPLLGYLALRSRAIAWGAVTGRYIALLALSNAIALILDYRALILWLLGERAAQL